MAHSRTSIEGVAARLRPRLFFSTDQACRAIPYLTLVVGDLRTAFTEAVYFGKQLKCAGVFHSEAIILRREQDAAVERFNRCVDELDGLGVELRDCRTGLVAIPATYRGREIRFLWWPGKCTIPAWQDLTDGPTQQRPLADLKRISSTTSWSVRTKVEVWMGTGTSDQTI